MIPVQIKIKEKKLLVKWNDDSETIIKLANLRRNCPCALCASQREEEGGKYIPIYTDEQLAVSNIQVVGNYALGISWKDGHNTGIYTFDQLKNIAQ